MKSTPYLLFGSLTAAAVLLAACIPVHEPNPQPGSSLVFGPPEGKAVGAPIWSPDGQKLAFNIFNRDNGDGEIYIMNLATGGASKVLEQNDIRVQSWSPGGTEIAYNSIRDIWLIDANGGSDPNLLGPGQVAAWSPDGQKIAIFDLVTENPESYELRLDDLATGMEEVVFSTGEVSQLVEDLAWSPDGNRLAFSLAPQTANNAPHARNIYIHNLETSQLSQFSFGNDDLHPEWSPNGQQIAYLHYSPGQTNSSIVISQTEGGCKTEIRNLKGVWSIAWSPDGNQLAYGGTPPGIYLLDLGAVFGKDFLTTGPTCPSPTEGTATP
jgi:Tol biopolymer transport system component